MTVELIADGGPGWFSVAVVLGLEGTGAGEVEVVGLRGAERGHLDAEAVEVEGGDLLVEVLGQDVDLVLVLAVVGEELDLSQHLVGEGGAHHKARVAGGAAEIDEPSLGQHYQPL